jgi:hypothetical protein
MDQFGLLIEALVCGICWWVTHAPMHPSRAEVTADRALACSRVLCKWMPTSRQALKQYLNTLYCGNLCQQTAETPLP